MKGDVVISPNGEEIVLVDIGLIELLDNALVRVWDVSLEPGGQHPWHLHHNPYVVLSLNGSDGRMDWLDGSDPRIISEYRGGAVYRPVSPVHRLTNIGDHFYRNRLVEFKDLGEHLPAPFDIGPGARSIEGQSAGPTTSDGREPVLAHEHVTVWTVQVPAGQTCSLRLDDLPHVLAQVDAASTDADATGGVAFHAGGPTELRNETEKDHTWFVVELTYTQDLSTILNGGQS